MCSVPKIVRFLSNVSCVTVSVATQKRRWENVIRGTNNRLKLERSAQFQERHLRFFEIFQICFGVSGPNRNICEALLKNWNVFAGI